MARNKRQVKYSNCGPSQTARPHPRGHSARERHAPFRRTTHRRRPRSHASRARNRAPNSSKLVRAVQGKARWAM